MPDVKPPRDRLIVADTLDALALLPDASVDCVITDPPYCSGGRQEADRRSAAGQGLRSETLRDNPGLWFEGDNMGTAGLTWLLRRVACECRRLLTPRSSMLVFCDWRMLPSLVPPLESSGLRYNNLVVWRKPSAGLGTGFKAQHELVIHLTNGAAEYFDRSAGNVLDAPRVHHSTRRHPTEKPVALIEHLLRVACRPGGLVLDPFGGSATTAEAARRTDRHFLCIDHDPRFLPAGRDRLAQVQRQLL